MKSTLGLALALFALGCMVQRCTGCAPKQLGASAAETAYTTELLRCVDRAATLAESRACRKGVNARWGITEVEAGAK